MPATLTIRDETTAGERTGSCVLEFLTERVTVRELIRSRVYQEVQDYNHAQPGCFRGLVQPTEAEATLNGYKLRKAREIDWKRQFDTAVQAFESNGFLILAGDRQLTDLDEQIVVAPAVEVTFLKLVPLVGG